MNPTLGSVVARMTVGGARMAVGVARMWAVASKSELRFLFCLPASHFGGSTAFLVRSESQKPLARRRPGAPPPPPTLPVFLSPKNS